MCQTTSVQQITIIEINSRTSGKSNILEENGTVTKLEVLKGDVVAFINKPENNGAVFQVGQLSTAFTI